MAETWARYELGTQPDGSIAGTWSTNDDEDRGIPGQVVEVPVSFRSLGDVLRITGGTHYGCSGIKVDVVLDGVYVPAPSRQAVPA